MRALIQRVSRASVTVEGKIIGSIDQGLLIFIGIREGDTEEDAKYLAARVSSLRIFNDSDGKMNLNIRDVSGQALVVSQFTLHAQTRKGNRPSYTLAADPVLAESLYNLFILQLRHELGVHRVATGLFRAMMQVELVNDGPVTILLKSKREYED